MTESISFVNKKLDNTATLNPDRLQSMPGGDFGCGFCVGFSHIFGFVSLYCGLIGGKLVASGLWICYKSDSYLEMLCFGLWGGLQANLLFYCYGEIHEAEDGYD